LFDKSFAEKMRTISILFVTDSFAEMNALQQCKEDACASLAEKQFAERDTFCYEREK
jgi:hypothetical protein